MRSLYAGHAADIRALRATINGLKRQLARRQIAGDARRMVESDAHALMRIHDAALTFQHEETRLALRAIDHRDSAVRDMVPSRLWDTAMRTVHGGERGSWLIHGWPGK